MGIKYGIRYDSEKQGIKHSKEDYVKFKVGGDIPGAVEKKKIPDLTLIYAATRSKAFAQALPGKIARINTHGNSPEEIKESYKAYHSLLLDVEDEGWTSTIGAGTYFVKGRDKDDKTNSPEEIKKKTATDEDFANLASLMGDSVKIFSLLKTIHDETIEGVPQAKRISTELAQKLSQQYLPLQFRRGMGSAVERVAFRAWAQLLSDKYQKPKAEESSVLGTLGTVTDAGGTATGTAAGKLSKLGIDQDSETVKASVSSDKYQNDRAYYTFKNSWNGGDILNEISASLTAVKEILGVVKSAHEESARETTVTDTLQSRRISSDERHLRRGERVRARHDHSDCRVDPGDTAGADRRREVLRALVGGVLAR